MVNVADGRMNDSKWNRPKWHMAAHHMRHELMCKGPLPSDAMAISIIDNFIWPMSSSIVERTVAHRLRLCSLHAPSINDKIDLDGR